uniref:GRIP domain-containing protein n=1 Tax=Arion vulgaris TaxID=1028688 RepID=A0A0B6YTS9_9EUPU
MGDDELFVEKAGGKEVSNRRINSGRKSLDNNATNTSDNGFGGRISALNSSSLSDITSVSSTSSNVGPLGTITSRMRFQLRHGQHGHESEAADYMTPLQRMEKEVKLLRKERSQLLSEKEEKDTELESMKNSIETMKLRMQREKENELADYVDKLRVSEREKFEQIEELFKVQEELTQMDVKYATIKREMSDKEEKYEEYLLDMYKKGQMAALFEREDELEMLATTPKSNVSVRELTRKLSKTELELAKWQGLKLGESYAHMELPDTQADATLSFLKDAFYHFLTERSGNEDHLRAIIKIFKYSETQMSKIRKGLEEFKHLDKKRITRI